MIVATINVNVGIDGPGFSRMLQIENLESTVPMERFPQDVHRYRATFVGMTKRRDEGPVEAEFEHRYGDDVFTLIAEAIDALGGRGGPQTTGLWR